MKFLIIAAKFGNGHLAVSNAIKKRVSDQDIVDIVIPSSYKYEKLSTKISIYSYNNIISRYTKKGPIKMIYNFSYNTARNNTLLHYWQKADGKMRSNYLLKKERPDVIIETFPHIIKNTYGALRCCIVTDYTFAKIYISETKDAIYCVPAPSVKAIAVNKFKLDPKNIYITGIPVKQEFMLTNNKTSCQKILLTLGARGQISKTDIDYLISLAKHYQYQLSIVCGKNEKIKEYLDANYQDINIYGFVNNMEELYQEADLIITKSGGISISECICSEKPILVNIDQSMSGQEEKNQDYINQTKIGLCYDLKNIKKGFEQYKDDAFYQQIVQNVKQAKHDNYQDDIISVIKKRRALLENKI